MDRKTGNQRQTEKQTDGQRVDRQQYIRTDRERETKRQKDMQRDRQSDNMQTEQEKSDRKTENKAVRYTGMNYEYR